MKKRPSMTAVNSRTCPSCFSMVDPVWYGWHITRCPSSDKLTSTQKPLSADMAPLTPVKNEVAEDSQFAEATLRFSSAGEASSVLFPATLSLTTALDSQTIANGIPHTSHTQSPDTESAMSSLRRENDALCQKVKDLTSKQEDLQSQLTLSKEAERKALCLVESLRAELREKDELCSLRKSNEEGLLSQLTQSRDVELKALDLVESLRAKLGKIYCGKPVEVVDLEECSDHLEERGIAIESQKNVDVEKKLDLDRIVDLACGEAAPLHGFLSQVDGSIKEACTSTVSTFGKQGDLPGALSNANNADGSQDNLGKCEEPDNVEHGSQITANLRDGSSLKDACHTREDHLFVSHGVEASQTDVDREVPSQLALTRVVLESRLVEKSNSTDGPKICQADRLASAKVVEDGVGNTNSLLPEEAEIGPCPETRFHEVGIGLNTEKQCSIPLPQASPEKLSDSPQSSLNAGSDLYAKQFPEKESHSPLLSLSAGSDVYTIKAKSGSRRIVLMSYSESESGPIQNIQSGSNAAKSHHCSSKVNASPDVSCEAEGGQSNQSSAGISAERRNTFMASGIEDKNCKTTMRRIKRLKVLSTGTLKSIAPNESADVSCEVQSEQSSYRRAKMRKIPAGDVTEAGVEAEGHTERDLTGVRRSKRLRTLSFWNSKNNAQNIELSLSPDEKSMSLKKMSSSHGKKCRNIEESEMSRSEASASSHSRSSRMHVERNGPSRTRKRLFEEAESRVVSPNKHTTDSEEDDSDEGESLGGFITDSEGREGSQTSDEDNSSSRAFSSEDNRQLKLYRNWRIMKELKLKNYVWDNEGEMVSAMDTDLELCVRAVCALNRRQTEDEQREKASKYSNKRGFDKLHAARGSCLAEFLTDGNPSGPMKKSVEDLRKHDTNALRFCKMLAFKHSKQLFEMYKNEEDPHFPCQ